MLEYGCIVESSELGCGWIRCYGKQKRKVLSNSKYYEQKFNSCNH